MFRRELASVLDAQKDTEGAIKIMTGIVYENGEDEMFKEKADDYLTLAEMWFDMGDSTQAEIYVNRTAHIIHKVDSIEQQLRYKRAYVQCADSKRDFTRAAQGYYTLSTEPGLDAEVV